MDRSPLTLGSFTKKYAKPLWGWYAAGLVTLAATNLISLYIPQLAKDLVNRLIEVGQIAEHANLALGIIGLGLLTIFIRTLSRIFIFWPGRTIEANSKSDLFARFMKLPLSFFQSHGMGDLISRLSNDVGHLRVFYAFGVLQILNFIFLMIFTISMMAAIHPLLTIACLSPLFLMLVISKFVMPYMHRYFQMNQEALGRLTNKVTEAFVNVHAIQSSSSQQSFIDRMEIENEAVYRTNIRVVFLRTLLFPLMTMLSGASQVVILFYGGIEVTAGRLTVGDILAFNVYIVGLTFPLTAVGIIMAVYQRAKTSIGRLSLIEEAEVEGPQAEAASQRPNAPLLQIENLSFDYPESQRADSQTFSLRDISLSIEPGQRIGLYGKVGSGKSTLLQLIARLYDPPAGTILWRGQDILAMQPSDLRSQIGFALQEAQLFSDSIATNLAFGSDNREPSKLEHAAASAQILPEIQRLADGWETTIGEKGVRLSGGQKQRLSLARLFLRDPALFLLDDVLSAVDQQTERALIEQIQARESAMIIASHRPSALALCDEIIILDQGRVFARGTLDDLSRAHPEMQLEVGA